MRKNILILFLLLPFLSNAQNVIQQKDLEYTDGKWNYLNTPFTGIAIRDETEMHENYIYCNGSPSGYSCYYNNGKIAGLHTYNGNEIYLEFYTIEGRKTLEYHQKTLDNTYTNGEWIDYRDDGTIQVKGNYTLIPQNGEGQVERKTQWQSVKDGKWYFYNEKEDLIKTENWKKGKLINGGK